MKVFVYRNLHKQCFSVKALDGPMKGKVVARLNKLVLTHCEFKVSKAGRKRVLEKKQKNVHAGVVGLWTKLETFDLNQEVTYNPYKFDQFYFKETEQPIEMAKTVLFDYPKVYV